MSNMTEGKKALEQGDFKVAETKLLKALDIHPDDSELWWALMLCKFGWKNESELARAVIDKFTAAAQAGEDVPSTPFETSYCKNALLYAKDSRRRNFIVNLYAELSAVWQQLRGKALRAPDFVNKTYKPLDKTSVLKALTYVCIALALAAGALAMYGLYKPAIWAQWLGFAALAVFFGGALALRFAVKKAGGRPKAALALIIIVIALTAVALVVFGMFSGNKAVVIIAAAIIGVIAAVGVFNVFFRTRNNGEPKPARDAREPTRRAAGRTKGKGNKSNSDGVAVKDEKNEFKDEYD